MLRMIAYRIQLLGVVAMLAVSASLAADNWVVRYDGIGPVRIGMTLPQLNTALHEKFVLPENKEDQGCFYVTPTKHAHISFMIEDGHLVRIDVDASGIATAAGIQVGDSEKRAVQVYGKDLKVEPHHYTEGRYLTIRSRDGRHGIRFETENGKIQTFYAGTVGAIEYVEGCS